MVGVTLPSPGRKMNAMPEGYKGKEKPKNLWGREEYPVQLIPIVPDPPHTTNKLVE